MPLRALISFLLLLALTQVPPGSPPPVDPPPPAPPGKLISVGGHRIHLNCTGAGSPTIVVENGLGDFSTDWVMVQKRVSRFTRICTYDRAGYAWSDPGPMPRTYPQLNLELHETLAAAGIKPPFVLVGHSFGGPVVRAYTAAYPTEVAGVVLIDTIHEDQRIPIMGKAVLLRGTATGRAIPAPRLHVRPEDGTPHFAAASTEPLEAPLERLPANNQQLHLWAEAQPAIQTAEPSQLEWSPESLALFHATPQKGSLGARPLIVLTRAQGGYDDTPGVPAAQLEQERLSLQKELVRLSNNSTQRILNCGHNMHLEAPAAVASAIRDLVTAVRSGKPVMHTAR
jgi:pimeloyl-ACP methyl ester carboxylesterase